MPENLAIFPAISVSPRKKKRYNFFLQSVPVISVDHHIYNTIRNLACHSVWAADLCLLKCCPRARSVHLRPFLKCDIYVFNLAFTGSRIYLHSTESDRRLELKPGEP